MDPAHATDVRATTEVASALISAQFPELRAARVHYLGEGCDSIAFAVDDAWVFRFPKRPEVEAQLMLELHVMPVLARESPLPLPAFPFRGRPANGYPFQFGGYARLQGVSATSVDPLSNAIEQCPAVLGRFLGWLRAFPIDRARTLGVQTLDAAALIEQVRTGALEALDDVRSVASSGDPVQLWNTYIERGPTALTDAGTPEVLVHADLAAEHILYDPAARTITGVIDWSEIAISEPAIDLSALYHWGGPGLVEQVLPHYAHEVDAASLERARWFAACRGAADVEFGLEQGRPEYVAGGIRALRTCCAPIAS